MSILDLDELERLAELRARVTVAVPGAWRSRAMTEGPFCAHQRVNLTPHIHEDGNRTDHWRCECGQVFMPVGSPLAETKGPVPGPSRGPQLWVWIGSDDDRLDVLRYVKATERDILRQPAAMALAERETNMNRAQQQASAAWLKTVSEYEAVLRDHGYDFEGEADCIDWLRNMLAGCKAAKEAAKP